METLILPGIVLLAIAAFALLVAWRPRRLRGAGPKAEDFLLQEAKVVEPIAPGMAGRIEVSKGGRDIALAARAQDPAQAFERGAAVRLIDYREGAYLVEPADEEHLVH